MVWKLLYTRSYSEGFGLPLTSLDHTLNIGSFIIHAKLFRRHWLSFEVIGSCFKHSGSGVHFKQFCDFLLLYFGRAFELQR